MRVFAFSLFTLVLVSFVPGKAYAAHGNEFIGVSAAGTALGGTGVSHYTNVSDALYRNPALLHWAGDEDGLSDFEFHLKFIKNNAKANAGAGLKTSASGGQILPTIATHYQVSDRLNLGLGFLSVAGNLVDQSANVADLTGVKVSNIVFRLTPSASYEVADRLSIGLTPILAIGGLALNEATSGTTSTRGIHYTTGLAFQLGVAYEICKGLMGGLSYTTETGLTYKEAVNLDAFGENNAVPARFPLDDVITQQPQQLGVGLAYALEALSLTVDYRLIQWSTADSFQSLGWQDQHVIAFGAQYGMDDWTFRGGVNYAKSPIRDVSGESGAAPVIFPGDHSVFARSVSLLNTAAFPGVAQTHVTVGSSYEINDGIGVDLGFWFAPEVTVTRSGTLPPALGGTAYSFTAQTSQWALHTGVRIAM